MYAPSSSSSCAEAIPCGVNSVPPEKNSRDARLADGRPHRFESEREGLEQLRRREHALDVVAACRMVTA